MLVDAGGLRHVAADDLAAAERVDEAHVGTGLGEAVGDVPGALVWPGRARSKPFFSPFI